jgi:hypothetical protein
MRAGIPRAALPAVPPGRSSRPWKNSLRLGSEARAPRLSPPKTGKGLRTGLASNTPLIFPGGLETERRGPSLPAAAAEAADDGRLDDDEDEEEEEEAAGDVGDWGAKCGMGDESTMASSSKTRWDVGGSGAPSSRAAATAGCQVAVVAAGPERPGAVPGVAFALDR